jgi:hypothetical protein
MRYLVCTLAMLLVTSCHAIDKLGVGGQHEVVNVKSMSHIPEYIMAGDSVILDFELGTEKLWGAGGYSADVVSGALFSSAGTIIPLEHGSYRPGDPIPTIQSVRTDDFETITGQAYQDGRHVYMLFVAPDTAQRVEVRYILGGGRPAPSSNETNWTLEVH